MFCPKCSERQASEETQFCPKCGFPTKGVKRLLEKGGEIESDNFLSPRQIGFRQGAKLILLGFILYPALMFLSAMFPPNDVLVESSPSSTWFEQIGWALLWTTFLAGVARILYAAVFESKITVSETPSAQPAEKIKQMNAGDKRDALPPSESIPVADFGKWKTTGSLFEPVYRKQKTSGELK